MAHAPLSLQVSLPWGGRQAAVGGNGKQIGGSVEVGTVSGAEDGAPAEERGQAAVPHLEERGLAAVPQPEEKAGKRQSSLPAQGGLGAMWAATMMC